jgi:hypothetical protein
VAAVHAIPILRRLLPETTVNQADGGRSTSFQHLLGQALNVIGLNRDIQHLFDPRHENGKVVRALGQHDDPIVRQYGVWAVIENDRLGLEHLGVPFDRLEDEPANVQAKLLQLGSSAIRDPHERHDFIWRGSNLESIDSRVGLAQGLTTEFYDGLREITVGWLASEESPRVRLLLAEHMACFSDEVPTYEEEALRLAAKVLSIEKECCLELRVAPSTANLSRPGVMA